MAFTKKIPEWNASGVGPPQSLKDSGWKPGVKPAADHFNWLQTTASEAIKELQQKAGEVKKVNGQLPDANGNVNVNIDTSKLATKEELSSASTYIQQEMNDLEQTVAAHQTDLAHVHWIGTATGTNALTATYESIAEYKDGLAVSFKNTTASTDATTLNINGLGAIPILKANGNAVTNLKANGVYTLRYVGGNFILQGEGGEYGTATASDVLSGKTFGTENGLVNGSLTLASLGGKKWASGTTENNRAYDTIVTFRNKVNGLSFKPSTIIIKPVKSIANPTIYTTNSPGGYAMNAGFGYLISTASYIQVYGSTVKPLDDGFEFLLQVNGPHTFLSDVTVDWIAFE